MCTNKAYQIGLLNGGSCIVRHRKILPEPFKCLYKDWIEVSPILLKMQKDNIYFEGISMMYFFIEFSIPLILKWSIKVKSNMDNLPCLMGVYYTKFGVN